MEAASPEITPERLMQLTGGYAPPLIIETALRLGVFDALDQGAKNIDQLLAATEASVRGMGMLLNALVSLDLLMKTSDDRFELTEESALFLVRGKPTFHGAFFLMTSGLQLPHWGKLTEIVTTGRPAQRINSEDDGTRFFLGFVEDIFPIHFPSALCVAAALNIAEARGPVSVLDLAAGSGVWSIALAKQSPHVRVTAVDWAAVIPVTKKVTTREGVADRYLFVEGDLLDADFGSGHAIATAGHILHSEGEERSRLLLKKTFDALAPGGTIAIAEVLVDADRRGPVPALMFAINMLVHTDQGGTFSFEEIGAWLRDASFEGVRTVPAPGLARQIIVATKPK
jgi:SAM-dependent methyltransferase